LHHNPSLWDRDVLQGCGDARERCAGLLIPRGRRTPLEMKALAWQGPAEVAVVDVEPRRPPDGWVIVEPSYVGICGTDLHIWAGSHPRAKPGLILGHEFVGRLAGEPVFVDPLLPCGHCRACLKGLGNACDNYRILGVDAPGGAAEQVLVPAERVHPLPSGTDMRAAALIEPLAVAVRSVRASGLSIGQTVHVIGGGPIGLLIALCAERAGARSVSLSEPAVMRQEVARALGFSVVEPTGAQRNADVVFDASGHPSVAQSLLEWACTGGTVVITGVYPGAVPLDLQQVAFRELHIAGIRCYSPSDIDIALNLVVGGRMPTERLLSSTVPLAEGPKAIERLSAGKELKVLLQIAP
jgi:(R,R)-butanediol dehydrogenase / meso-butanediol dehydrogenase / diacetyl reductase